VNVAKVRLLVAAALFVGWLAWLSYTAAAKYRGPVVSHVQAAAAAHAVAADLFNGDDGKPNPEVKVAETFTEAAPAAGTEIYVVNLADAKGYEGPGRYLLLLTGNTTGRAIPINGKDVPIYSVVGLQRSPGYELAGSGSPVIYKLTDGVRAQIGKLLP
jgi:hypothetical protein